MPEIEVLLPGFSINTDQATLGLCTVTLIRGEKLTLVDVGHFGRRNQLVATLESHGLVPTDIQRVILTHAHWDHSQNTDMFPNAEIVIHAKELEYSRNPRVGDYATSKYFADTLTAHSVLEVNDETQIEEGVGVFDTPGHTRGHISALVDTAGGRVCIGGDAMSDAGALARGLPAFVFWSEDEARRSIAKVADASPVVYPGHDRPFRISGEDIEYLVEAPTIKISGFLDGTGDMFSMEVGLPPKMAPGFHPEARSQSNRA
jgi:glyoxylase-like metal-dependent hydrolase (beta-lactamase superfamily II)